MLTGRRPFRLVEENLRHAMAFYSNAHKAGEVRQLPGLQTINCGWNYPVFNSALLTSPVPGADGELNERLTMASVYFRALRMGWSCWACHDLLNEWTLGQLREICSACRLEPVVSAPGMYADKLRAPLRTGPELEIRDVSDAPTRLAFAHLVSIIFELPFPMTRNMYASESSWKTEYGGFIGYFNGRPVTIAMANVSDSCCGFYSVGTVAGQRRRGFAEAVMREAYHRMRIRLPFDGCVLQSSTVGRRLYEQMGFREVTRFSVFRAAPG